MRLKFLGHAAFALEDRGTRFLFDPFISNNPTTPVKPDELQADYIFVSHAHGDHIGDAADIAKRTGATVISTFEIANHLAEKGCTTHAMHIGGTYRFPFGKVRCTIAFHGSGIAGGFPCGWLINSGSKTFYHSGDTALTAEFGLLARVETIDLACLPIGGNYTMDASDAVVAAEMLQAKTIVPMHYNTWPPIQADVNGFKREVESRTNSKVAILQPGEELEF